jgi:hypothetical protein
MTLATDGITITIAAADIPGVTSLSGPGESVTMIDSTDLADTTMQRIAGLLDSGEVTLAIDWNPDEASHATIRSTMTSRAAVEFVITWPDAAAATTYTFDAFVSAIAPSATVNDKLTMAVTLTITGAIVAA